MNATFLLATLLTTERLDMLSALATSLTRAGAEISCFITGEALHSLADARLQPGFERLGSTNGVAMMSDATETRLLGIDAGGATTTFWRDLASSVSGGMPDARAGFLQLLGPYHSRTTVHATRFLEACVDESIAPELYLYIDGIHAAHAGQAPSEFENTGETISRISRDARAAGLDPRVLACSRCATARGYATPVFDDEHVSSDHAIPEVSFVNLNKVIERFTPGFPVLAPASFHVPGKDDGTPALVLFVSSTPYGSEMAFGAVSMAIAAALNHDIPATVAFIENGVHCTAGRGDAQSGDKVFDLPGVLEATSDDETLSFVVSSEALARRGLRVHPTLEDHVEVLDLATLACRVAAGLDATGTRGIFT